MVDLSKFISNKTILSKTNFVTKFCHFLKDRKAKACFLAGTELGGGSRGIDSPLVLKN